jgi:hypothetical protein
VRVRRLALATLVYPHELVHYAALRPWSADLRVLLAPPRDETRDVPLARLDGTLAPDTPLLALRAAALAPTLVYPLLAVLLGRLPLPPAVALALVVPLAVWAAPSTGDVGVALDPESVRAAGRLDARGPTPRGASALSALLSVAATLVAAGALLA